MDLYQLYQNLFLLTKKQQEAIKDRNMDKLFELINKKQKTMDKIDEINFEDFLKKQSNPKDVFKKMEEIMQKTDQLAQKNEELLKQNKLELFKKIMDLGDKQKSKEGYNPKKEFEAKFIDEKS